jgi:DNA-directed RNA polymerase sigma subunit (sigma70/sigma32)
LAERLRDVEEAVSRYRDAEDLLEQERERLYESLREAHRAGASFQLLGDIAGLSRQRVKQIIDFE